MALIGNGAQSEFQALAFQHLLGITDLRVYDVDPAASAKLVANLQGSGLRITVCASTAEAVKGADIVTTVTADKRNATILTPEMIEPGMHLNAVGGDCPGKTELHGDILDAAKVFVEYEPQSRIEGEIQHKGADFAVTEFWQVLRGERSGRDSADQVTVFDSVGFALEDFSALRFMQEPLNAWAWASASPWCRRWPTPRTCSVRCATCSDSASGPGIERPETSAGLDHLAGAQQPVLAEAARHQLHAGGQAGVQPRRHRQAGQAQHRGAQQGRLRRQNLAHAVGRALIVVHRQLPLPRIGHQQHRVALQKHRPVACDVEAAGQRLQVLVAVPFGGDRQVVVQCGAQRIVAFFAHEADTGAAHVVHHHLELHGRHLFKVRRLGFFDGVAGVLQPAGRLLAGLHDAGSTREAFQPVNRATRVGRWALSACTSGAGTHCGSSGVPSLITASASRASATVRASGPCTDICWLLMMRLGALAL
jgi:hypothetical protein